ncbi:MAG: hypothetical protein HQL11_05560, partial [Candidatus Omnitrophica bacterium]|nr:hypothetical protein [Candidatus Omnitrophota bacterium]
SDREIQAGQQNILTFGVNWYLNDAMKVVFNYSITDFPEYPGAELEVYKMRVALSF